MAPIRRQSKASDTKQVSFHLTSDVYAIVRREAAAQSISMSAWISHLISTHYGERRPQPAEPQRTALPDDAKHNTPAPDKRPGKIELPDPDVGVFTVDRDSGAVRGKRLKSDSELSGVEGGAPKRKGRNRNEEVDL